jgi:hypothetical protein
MNPLPSRLEDDIMIRKSTASCLRLSLIVAVIALVAAPPASAQEAPLSTSAGTPKVLYACYVPASGTVYRIKEPGMPQQCNGASHVEFSWTDGAGALRSGDAAGGDLTGHYPNPLVARLQGHAVAATTPAEDQALVWSSGTWQPRTLPSAITNHGDLTGLDADDHPQYLRADGARALSAAWNVGGFRITGLAAATAAGDAVRFEQAVKAGDAADGDLAGSFPNPLVRGLRGRPIANLEPGSGHVLTYDGSQ